MKLPEDRRRYFVTEQNAIKWIDSKDVGKAKHAVQAKHIFGQPKEIIVEEVTFNAKRCCAMVADLLLGPKILKFRS